MENHPGMNPMLRNLFIRTKKEAIEAPPPNPEPKRKGKGKDDSDDELSFEYIVSKKPKPKVVKKYLKKFLNDLYDEGSSSN
jgi:hypothetical protein